MTHSMAYKTVMREFERDRARSERTARERKETAYAETPKLRDIDDALAKARIAAAKLAVSGKDAGSAINRADALSAERRALLKASGKDDAYFTDVYTCPVCHDTGYVGAQKCRCFIQRLVKRFYNAANVGDMLETENFSTFDARYYDDTAVHESGKTPRRNIQDILSCCLDFTENFDNCFQNMLFYGDTGLGKTFLCNCIAKRMLDMGKTALYVTAPRIFKKIEDYRFNRAEMEAPDEQIDMIYSTDLLIIDDLGSEFSTVLTSTELFNIINSRVLEKKHTVISTNLSLNDFQSIYSDRIVSRLFGNYRMLRFFGDDIRLKKKYSMKDLTD